MPNKPYRFKKRQRCPINQTELTSVKDAHVSLLSHTHLGSKLLTFATQQENSRTETDSCVEICRVAQWSLQGHVPTRGPLNLKVPEAGRSHPILLQPGGAEVPERGDTQHRNGNSIFRSREYRKNQHFQPEPETFRFLCTST